jgi:Response regulator containing CheY-like receiver, AAA-type ATPase, and DNA-binding domains
MKQKTILWVDDEIELLRSHVIFLTEKGYNVLTVTNGIDALETIDESEVDLVFLDEMMPGLGGLEVLAKIKDKTRTFQW